MSTQISYAFRIPYESRSILTKKLSGMVSYLHPKFTNASFVIHPAQCNIISSFSGTTVKGTVEVRTKSRDPDYLTSIRSAIEEYLTDEFHIPHDNQAVFQDE